MGDKEIKACLKEAREQIKNKDFKSALKECKKVLNKDKNNYMALVFCGLCLSELDQADQSLQAYRRAAESSPDQPVAWEGMAKFYEKHKSSVNLDHYLEVLKKLVEFYSEEECKHFDVCSKLAQLQLENKDLDGSIATLQSQSEKSSENQEKYKESLGSLIKVLTSQPSLTDDQSLALLNALEKTVSDNQTPTNMENLKHLIKLQYKLKSISNLVITAVKMIGIFPENIYPLEWMCKIYLETVAGVWSLEDEDVFDNIETHFSALLSYSNSPLAELARGAFLFKKGSLEDCVTLLKKITNIQTPNFYGLYILCKAQLALGEESGVEVTAVEALKYTSKVKDGEKRADMTHFLQLCLVQALYNQLSIDKIKKAVQILENCDSISTEITTVAAKVYATIGDEKKARNKMSSIANMKDCDKQLIEALILKASGEIGKCISTLQGILSEFPADFEVTILLAQSLYEQGRTDESFGLFLKAAKLKPSHWLPFFHLGKQYESQGTEAALDKARKCYQKCLQLSGDNNVEAATSLSDILRGQGRHEDNLALLSRVTQEAGTRGGAVWAWLRLGVHHLAVDEPARGVTALQNALRSEPDNIVCWEALGDAYMARGSYVAARKAFEKVLSMSNESLYSRLMIADIRQKLGYHEDAIADYSELLENNPDYLPALRGLGETHISLAYVNLKQFVDLNVLDCCESAISALTRAAILQPGMAGTWRLLGEAASLVSALSEAAVPGVRVPSVLLRTEAGPEDSDVCTRAALLELSVRCYTKSLALEPRAPPTWHDLGLAQAAAGSLDTATVSLKRAISLDPRQAQFWNSLGLILTKQENWALAQHCFIKSLELDTTSMAWTNLGVVYLSIGEQGLANKAFKEAQNSDPDYIRGWTGQAILAEIVGVRSEAMDLFRHCTFLGPEPESGRGYSDWVCGTLASLDRKEEVEAHNRYILRNMWGVSVGLDSLTAYTRRHPRDVTALVQLGVLAERQGMLVTALEATQAALAEVRDQSQRDGVLTNLGRLLTKAGRCDEAVASYREVSQPSLYSQVGLAMALYKLGEYQLSFQSYDSCLHWLADNDGLKSHVLVAMGSLAYKVEGIEAAKTLLFKSCQLSPPSVRGLFALAVIGVQHTDMNLIEAALHEMKPHVTDPRYAADIAFLTAAVLVLKGDVAGARRSLLASAHSQPSLPRLWSVLGLFLLQNCPQDTARAAARLATKAGLMRQSVGDGAEMEREEPGVESMVVSTLALIMAGDREAAMSRASHACHVYPHVPETWSLLAAAARTGQSPASSSSWLPRVLSHVIRLGSDNVPLTQWATRVASAL